MNMQDLLKKDSQAQEIATYLANHPVTSALWGIARKCRNVTIRVSHSKKKVPYGAMVKDLSGDLSHDDEARSDAGATINLMHGTAMGVALIYCTQEVYNVTKLDQFKQLKAIAAQKILTRNDYIDQVEEIEYGAFVYRFDLAAAMDLSDPLPKAGSWQYFNSNIARNDRLGYMALLGDGHKQKIGKVYDGL